MFKRSLLLSYKSTISNNFHPFVIIPFILKQFNVATMIVAANEYGYPRIYRRLLEGLKLISINNINNNQRILLKQHMKSTIRTPSNIYNIVSNHEVTEFMSRYIALLLQHEKIRNVPPFMITLAKIIAKRTTLGKYVDLVEKTLKKK
jgi:hypothetical protein